MKIVLDTTELVSGSFWYGPSRDVTQRVYNGSDTMYVTDAIIEEISVVFMRSKFRYNHKYKKDAVAKIKMAGTKIVVGAEHKAPPNACRDPNDIKFLECAAAAQADYIISGDSDLLDMKEYNGIKIVNAKDYLDIVKP